MSRRVWSWAVVWLVASAPAWAGELRLAAVAGPELSAAEKRVAGLVADGRLGIVSVSEPDDVAHRHERLLQYHRGVPVWGAGLTRQLGPRGTVSVFGQLHEGLGNLDVTPDISADGVRVIASGLAGRELGPAVQPKLFVLPLANGEYALAFRVRALVPKDSALWAYFIDAKRGVLLYRYNDLQTQQAASGTGTGVLGDRKKMSVSAVGGAFLAVDLRRPARVVTYDFRGNIGRFADFANGGPLLDAEIAQDDDDTWTDGPTVDAHNYAGWTYDYYYKRHGRHGIDDADLVMRNVVNAVPQSAFFQYGGAYPDLFINAFWDSDRLFMFYGVGAPVTVLGKTWKSLAGGLDIAAHELTHGVTQFTSDLIYVGESGALNEAFSDIMGVSVEAFQLGQTNYVIGDDVITPGGLRSMQNPSAYGDPDHYSLRYTGELDNGGVHHNSSIVNHAFYLAVEGGKNRVSGIPVAGVGSAQRERIEKIFYRAFTAMLTPQATFADARAATIQSARDLYGDGSPALAAVTQAWNAVGVN